MFTIEVYNASSRSWWKQTGVRYSKREVFAVMTRLCQVYQAIQVIQSGQEERCS